MGCTQAKQPHTKSSKNHKRKNQTDSQQEKQANEENNAQQDHRNQYASNNHKILPSQNITNSKNLKENQEVKFIQNKSLNKEQSLGQHKNENSKTKSLKPQQIQHVSISKNLKQNSKSKQSNQNNKINQYDQNIQKSKSQNKGQFSVSQVSISNQKQDSKSIKEKQTKQLQKKSKFKQLNQLQQNEVQALQKSRKTNKTNKNKDNKLDISVGKQSEDYLGVESKVQKSKINQLKYQNQYQKLSATVYHVDKKLHKNSKQNQNTEKLYHSQRKIGTQKTINKQNTNYANFDSKKIIQNQTQNKVGKQKKSAISDLQGEQLDRSMKSEMIARENAMDNTIQNNDQAKNSRNKNQYFSVIQKRRGFQERFVQDNKKVQFAQILQEKIQSLEDCLIQQNDQEGIVKIPIESSYHANSKHTIEIPSKKQLSVYSSKIADKYLKDLENKIIYQRTERKSQEQEGSVKGFISSQYKKESKLDTAFFKNSIQKVQLQSINQKNNSLSQEKLNKKDKNKNPLPNSQHSIKQKSLKSFQQNSQHSVQQKLKQTTFKKKAGPILFSQISFEKDSDFIPDQEKCSNDPKMSIHLNLTQICQTTSGRC